MSSTPEINENVGKLDKRVAESEGLPSTSCDGINGRLQSSPSDVSRRDVIDKLPTDVTEQQRYMLWGTDKISPSDDELRTIESAPLDGANILAKVYDLWYIVHWEEYSESMFLEFGERGYWTFSDPHLSVKYYNADFLHWIPVPDG
ncbi:hypothetical protein Q0601_14980 [Paracoccus onubensis]|uniref:hypothetical protein n=1 Tax=Paracoccus onubensis TaxID=1675788 RepID=UPI002730B5BF|nr:hypothetical protein [Paracoccus onubensis]MDP0928488.1 hypothetical protein [Paracoccus onubensis]